MEYTKSFSGKFSAGILSVIFIFTCCTLNAQLKLYSNGNISIGSVIQPPANTELQVVGNTAFSGIAGAPTSSAYIKGLNAFSTDSLPDYSWWGDTLTGILHPSSGTFAFTNAGIETMRLSTSNNILIGSKSDNGDRLQVTGALNKNPFDIYANYNSSGYSGINWLNDTTTKAWDVKYNGQDKFYVYGDGQAYSYGWNTMSDSTLKENVHEIQNALRKVLRLEGVTYNLKIASGSANLSNEQFYSSSEKMGLIAQAVERVVPEVVSTAGNGKKTVAYGNLVGLLVEALKQEDSKITILQHSMDSLIAVEQQNSNDPGTLKKEAILYPCKNCLVKDSTVICCYIPGDSKDANLVVTDMNGKIKKNVAINGRATQYVALRTNELSAGMYYYTLVVDGNEIATRKVILTD